MIGIASQLHFLMKGLHDRENGFMMGVQNKTYG
jgi:hypothetical protein